MKISADLTNILGAVMIMSFVVNIVVQMTKGFIPIPTKLWCIIVSAGVTISLVFICKSSGLIAFGLWSILLCVFGSFIIAFISMYGFDTFKDLWQRFKAGENINEDN